MKPLTPSTSTTPRPILQLDDATANRIAAGEVVERPSSAIKELVENAIDAGAQRIDIAYANGGKTMIRVSDDGHGIPADQLPLALSRHATSKIDGNDLLNINTFGFRGEALPSMGAVGRLTITSRAGKDDTAAQISVNGGVLDPVRPAALDYGTTVELRDLFHATPARLKFLRSDRAEAAAITDIVKRLAMAEPMIGFTLRDQTNGNKDRIVFRADPESDTLFQAILGRLRRVLGSDFAANSIPIDIERDGMTLTGYASLPTYSRASAIAQYIYVNGRPIKDKLLIGALRAAYSDFLYNGRHPVMALFLECPPEYVDVNVHPGKSEVRFRNPSSVRSLIITGLHHGLSKAGNRVSSTLADKALSAFTQSKTPHSTHQEEHPAYQMDYRPNPKALSNAYTAQRTLPKGFSEDPHLLSHHTSGHVEPLLDNNNDPTDAPLGAARAQIHQNYIIAQTTDGIVIVDQHAAHERLVYEKLKKQMADNNIVAQTLLIPEIINLSAEDYALMLEHQTDLATLGLGIKSFGGTAIAIHETPALLGEINATTMVKDIIDELKDTAYSQNLRDKLEAILSRVACHGSIRSGRIMRAPEMNALLREMETTPHSSQCNHGRPTYIELKLSDIERLFKRT